MCELLYYAHIPPSPRMIMPNLSVAAHKDMWVRVTKLVNKYILCLSVLSLSCSLSHAPPSLPSPSLSVSVFLSMSVCLCLVVPHSYAKQFKKSSNVMRDALSWA